ncbi:MAG: transposase [Gammaproteobacteria bacterium]|nr:transposase [Gammaproteobacteria bacterium]
MTRARNSQIDLDSTSYYHVINRCIKRSFLCGKDRYSGKNYEHRRQWLIDRIKKLATIYSIDIAAYAIMSNHYHLVLHVDKKLADSWTMDQVIERWYRLFKGNLLVDNYLNGDKLSPAHLQAVIDVSQVWRKRLHDISWFMKCLNEYIARASNKEDKCSGKFWEGRFKSQALLDEVALLSCMAYVDLNPIRAGVCDTLRTSEFTSIRERIIQYHSHQQHRKSNNTDVKVQAQPPSLLPFANSGGINDIPFKLDDYLELVSWSGRHVDPNKLGSIAGSEPIILNKLGIEQDTWLETIKNFRRKYGSFAGSANNLRSCAHAHGHEWYKGVG